MPGETKKKRRTLKRVEKLRSNARYNAIAVVLHYALFASTGAQRPSQTPAQAPVHRELPSANHTDMRFLTRFRLGGSPAGQNEDYDRQGLQDERRSVGPQVELCLLGQARVARIAGNLRNICIGEGAGWQWTLTTRAGRLDGKVWAGPGFCGQASPCNCANDTSGRVGGDHASRWQRSSLASGAWLLRSSRNWLVRPSACACCHLTCVLSALGCLFYFWINVACRPCRALLSASHVLGLASRAIYRRHIGCFSSSHGRYGWCLQ